MTPNGKYDGVRVLFSLLVAAGPTLALAGTVNLLELPGACCLSDGTCAVTLPDECYGFWGGPLTECAGQDCNGNGADDFCDIASMYSTDCDHNGVPDECQPFEDCDGNGVTDFCDLAECDGSPWCSDCNDNQVLDVCDIATGTSLDVMPPGGDGIPDECQSDCNGNGIPDDMDIANGTSQDCNSNSIPDECDLANGTSLDVFPPGGDGVPDECEACIHNVTQDTYFAQIQAALDAAADGDELIVGRATYPEAINFLRKAVYLHSFGGPAVTIIDATGLDTSVVTCTSGEGPGTILDGFTITGGTGTPDPNHPDTTYGGGMYNSGSSPTVTNCTFGGNWADFGGGMNNSGSSPTVTNCTFSGNSAWDGAGMYNGSSNPTVTNCTFSGNWALDGAGMFNGGGSSATVTNCLFSGNRTEWSNGGSGGGMYNSGSSPTVINCMFSGNGGDLTAYGGGMNNSGSSPTVTNCTFSGNSGWWLGGGGMSNWSSSPTVTNCILWGDTAQEIYVDSGTPVVSCCDVQGGYAGSGNINADPLFVVPGHWDDNGTPWTWDDFWVDGDYRLQPGSPCIDAGDPNFVPAPGATDLDGRLRVWDGNTDGVATVDMGAYEFGASVYGDMNCDGTIDFGDINPFVLYLSNFTVWQAAYPSCPPEIGDINGDGIYGQTSFGDINPFVTLLSQR